MCDSVYVSLVSRLSLSEYVQARSAYCLHTHASPCSKCERLLQVASVILEQSYCSLAQAFKMAAAPGAKYVAERARSLLLQMPLVSIRIGRPSQGNSLSILMEKVSGMDYSKLGAIMNSLAVDTSMPKGPSLEKSVVKMLLSIAESDRERECMRYAIYKASGITPSQARRRYGFECMQARALSVEAAISEIKQIREAIEDLARIEDRALLTRFGIPIESDTSSSESEEDEDVSQPVLETHYSSSAPRVVSSSSLQTHVSLDVDTISRSPPTQATLPPHASGCASETDEGRLLPAPTLHVEQRNLGSLSLPTQTSNNVQSLPVPKHMDPDVLRRILVQSRYNWFEFVEQVEDQLHRDISNEAESVFLEVSKLKIVEKEMCLLKQSYLAYCSVESDMYDQDRTARAINGEVVSESESDTPEAYVGLREPLSTAGKRLLAQKRAALRRRSRRRKAKAISNEHFLSRKVPRRVSRILQECPNLGETIESFVEEHNVGADAWRRTGILTFDGNTRLKEKVTYEKIRQHLQKTFGRKFSYGTVIQLCVPRNKRRRSAKRYRGIAKVTSRRARKGFNLKLNPDEHWSAALYKGLSKLQYVDGRDMININRDDSTGFRLDTLATCKQYTTPVVRGKEVLTTRTDYVNKYPSTLQTTSYNFTATATTGEVCVGVVKAPKVHQKSPAQHIGDLCMLECKDELASVFVNPVTGLPKAVECIRVDGAVDEGPSHDEVQFWWTQRHITKERLATLVTTRCSGSSYLNRVELQNGCLSLGHANTFIPSTLAGTCMNVNTGAVDEEMLRKNLNLAISAYISRVDGCPCGETSIRLYRGADTSDHTENRDHLLTFLKGSKTGKETLRREHPQLYAEFQDVWNIRQRHMIQDLPNQYIFMLLCCFKAECSHPLCKKGQPTVFPTWYCGGPPITQLPLPVLDPDRPWGNPSCDTCKDNCTGHYKIEMVDVRDKKALLSIAPPPSSVLKDEFSKMKEYPPTEQYFKRTAAKVLLSPDTTRLWVEHLHTVLLNRKRGAQKAAATRRAKKAQLALATDSYAHPTVTDSDYRCGSCAREYREETEEEELWVGCDVCDHWYCSSCEGLQSPPCTDTYICIKCRR